MVWPLTVEQFGSFGPQCQESCKEGRSAWVGNV